MAEQSIDPKPTQRVKWSDHNQTVWPDDYRALIYSIWYQNSKPSAKLLEDIIPINEEKKAKPGLGTLNNWIVGEFMEAAVIDDEKAMALLHDNNAVNKVEMLMRHAALARKMQDLAVKYFSENDVDTLKARDAINLLVAGIKIERESMLPAEKEFTKIAEMSDSELYDELEKLANTTILDVVDDTPDEE